MRTLVWVVASMILATAVRADLVQSLSNPNDGMAVDGSRADWASVTPFVDDSIGEAGIGPFDVDWQRVSMAHATDGTQLYIRYEMNTGADFNSFPAFYNIYIDADQDRGTGYIGGGSQFALGADYLIQGVSVFSFNGGSQTDFSWAFLGAGSSDNSFANLDIEIAVNPALFGSPTTFNFLVLGDNTLSGHTEDYYPDSSNTGASGGYFQYTIPEPGSLSLALVAAGLLGALRRVRRKPAAGLE